MNAQCVHGMDEGSCAICHLTEQRDALRAEIARLQAEKSEAGAWLFDDGSSFRLVGIAGGAHKDGIYAEVQCEELSADGRLTIHNYTRTNRQEIRASAHVPDSRENSDGR